MKMIGVLFLIGTLQTFAGSVQAQNTKVSLNLENVSVEQVINEIEKKSDFYFLFNKKLIDVDKIIEVDVKDTPIKDVLNNIFDGENIDFIVYDRQIILTPKEISWINDSETQDLTVKGVVTDAVTGEPLPGVNIVMDGTTTGVITDIDGKYTISLPDANATLVFSYVGYLAEKVAVEGRSTVDVVLAQDITRLEEVVVIGYGTLQRKELTSVMSIL